MRPLLLILAMFGLFTFSSVFAQSENSAIQSLTNNGNTPSVTNRYEILKIDGSKTYENNTKTLYVTLNKSIDPEKATVLAQNIEGNPNIHRFSFWNKSDYRKFMFTSDASITKEEVVDILNRELVALPIKTTLEQDGQQKQSTNNSKERIFVNPSELKSLKPTQNQ